ncbi:hypothetical protein LY90DRAFT_514349 [Neocallimastix californiae]|uniref:Velvet domain-containing protein n=1 Tax=Neocallimastix californiae TaxID=1754190 RepID=A0A1Y2ARD4_9FUNG|nr:hypothetical protein LY90DRAFT_514349 [Neocallimastix californiae]|eukprot:ORY25024.1 hypothetical protein LY90DRAFT_514349 [Neocallimastix californiae]
MSKSNNYNPDYYIKNNEKSIYDKHLNNQEYSSNKEKDFPTFTPVSIKQPQLSQPQELIQLPSSQQSLPNINNMLNYELNNINEETDNNLLKKSKLQKTFYKLPTASYRLKNKNYIQNNSNMNNDNMSNSINNMNNTNNMDMSMNNMNNMNMRPMNNINNINNMVKNNMNNMNMNSINNINNMKEVRNNAFKKSNQLDDDYNLIIRQQPAYARCSNFNDKERRPIDPPPIIQLVFGNEYMDDSSTNYFIKCEFH